MLRVSYEVEPSGVRRLTLEADYALLALIVQIAARLAYAGLMALASSPALPAAVDWLRSLFGLLPG